MPLPSATELQSRQKVAEERIERLKTAYSEFASAWKEIEKEESGLLKEVHDFIDKAHIHNVLSKIDSIKDE